ncbi:MAG: bis(5'-nucleosyl)-tetraphosphatase (symmetrical) [Rhodoferax sp.]|jgi:bis(5'-nucleosyl)-tetraphosphatase (symmetrical)
MAYYLIGDIQGCDSALGRLLDEISFSPSRDTLYLLGDLVNRGPDSAAVLRRLNGYGATARCLLGNHDLHLLSVAHGVRKQYRNDTLDSVLLAPDRPVLLNWLRQQHLAMFESWGGEDFLMVHAGVLPSWTAHQTVVLAGEVEAVLRSPDWGDFLQQLYGSEPNAWQDSLTGTARLRVIVNALTRLRFCDADGHMEFASSGDVDTAPAGFMPWFEVPGRQTADTTVAFGHWSTLGWLGRPKVLSLDTGCVWGGCLSALRLSASGDQKPLKQTLMQVKCEQAQQPG